jgi:hypothetical protein
MQLKQQMTDKVRYPQFCSNNENYMIIEIKQFEG